MDSAGIDPAAKAALIGVLFQQGALFSSLSVAQNVMLPMREHTSLPLAAQEQLAAVKLELAGLAPDADTDATTKVVAGLSLLLWTTIIVLGRILPQFESF